MLASANARSIYRKSVMVMLILVFRMISVISELFTYLNTSAQPPDQRGSDNQGCTVVQCSIGSSVFWQQEKS